MTDPASTELACREQALSSQIEGAAYRKVSRRLIPFLVLCYVLSYLDRVNVGFARLQMLTDLNFSNTVFGLGTGIFFIGYFVFEVPSNIIMYKVGARIWIARIMITWGIISASTLFVRTPAEFYGARLLLGLAEAAFSPRRYPVSYRHRERRWHLAIPMTVGG